MKRLSVSILTVSAMLALGACSSSPSTTNGVDPTLEAQPDAATDLVAQSNADDPSAPPTDPSDPAAPPAPDALAEVAAPPVAEEKTEAPAPETQAVAAEDTTPASPAGSGAFEKYTVRTGDTLMKIAFETYGDLYRWKGILEANKDKVKNPNLIPAGTVLDVEKPASDATIARNGEKYLIKNGDTLGLISGDVYGTQSKWKKLWENNKQLIHDPNKIFAGFFLYYMPEGTSVTPTPLAEKKMPSVKDGTDVARAPAAQVDAGVAQDDPLKVLEGVAPGGDQTTTQ